MRDSARRSSNALIFLLLTTSCGLRDQSTATVKNRATGALDDPATSPSPSPLPLPSVNCDLNALNPKALMPGKILLELHSSSGFTTPKASFSLKCEIYAEKAVLTKTVGNGSPQITSVEIALPECVSDVLKSASAEELKVDNKEDCDAGFSSISAILDGRTIPLQREGGGCGKLGSLRLGPESTKLIDFARSKCRL